MACDERTVKKAIRLLPRDIRGEMMRMFDIYGCKSVSWRSGSAAYFGTDRRMYGACRMVADLIDVLDHDPPDENAGVGVRRRFA